MKKLMAVILCLCLFITGCAKKNEGAQVKDDLPEISDEKDIESGKNDSKDEEIIQDAEDKDKPQLLRLSKEWSAVTLAGISQPDYNIPAVEPKVEPYVINKDLSNVVNIDRFSGFTREQTAMLAENGFVVLPGGDTKMYYLYDSNEYLRIPSFITSDSVLHLYHQFYDKSLMHIETDYLYNYMDIMTSQMLDKSIRLLDVLEDADMKALQEKNIIYFLVARMLMSETMNLDIKAKDALYNVAKEEYQLIEKAEGFLESPLLGFDFDYSQFTIRGHYTRSEELGRFFRALMWFGTAQLPFVDKEGNVLYENVILALLMTYTTFLDTEFVCDAELWNNIYQPTKQYVGDSDDINVFMMNGLRLEVFGEIDNPNIFNDRTYYDKLVQAVKDLPEPGIKGKFITVSTPAEKQFRYMGQRYIMDSYIMQNLIVPILRPMPTVFDVMGVFGSKYAEEILFNQYKPQELWPEYEENYNALKEEIAGYEVDTWGDNLYNGWLWSIKENLKEHDKDSGMPYFMTNDAWTAKSLNTAIGSYTELKHDTVLYGKQSAAESGGDMPVDKPYHYVEPNVNLYSKLLYLTEYTMSVLRERDMLNSDLEQAAEEYKSLLELLITCSIKELQNEKLTDEEYDELLYYGGWMEHISMRLVAANDAEANDIADMLVTDIATNPGEYLSLGTGYFDHIYVVIPVDGKLYLSRGSVYSTYEFISGERLTDEEWWELNGIKVVREEYADYPEYIEPSPDLPEQPQWIENFKSNENNVDIERTEVGW